MNTPTLNSRLFARCAIRLAACVPGLPALFLAAATLAPAAPTPAPLDQAAPAMASGGGVTLAVWQDSRDGAYSDIYGACLDSAGQVLNSFAIAVASGSQVKPAVACNGTDFLVVWADYRNGPSADVYGARVTSAGAVLDAAGFPISAGAGNQLEPAVASDGQNYFVVWQEGRDSSIDIFGARVSATGAVLDPDGVIVSQAANNEVNPAIAGGPTGYLVVWQDYRSGTSSDIYSTCVNTAGVALDPAGIAISTAAEDQLNPTASADGTGFMVAWQDFRSGSQFDIYGTRVSSAGAVGSPIGTVVSAAANDQANPSLAWNGAGYLAAWTDGRVGSKFAVYATRITSAGAVSDVNGLLLNSTARDQYHPAAAANGAGFWVTWQDLRNGVTADIFGTRLTAGGSVSDSSGVLISTEGSAPPPPQTPVITWGTPASIAYGTVLGSSQLSATANVPGTFHYTPAVGAVLPAGNQTLLVVFTPNDSQTYTTASATTSLNVLKKSLTVTANSAARLYGAANPPLSGTLAGVVNNDAITASFTCAATIASPVGSYTITPSLSDPNGRLVNYTVASVNGTLTVNPAPLTIRSDDKTKVAGQPNPPLTATYQGFVNGDSAATLATPVSLTTTATASSPAGAYPIVASGAASPNYSIAHVNGTLTVTPATPVLVRLAIQPASASLAVAQTRQFSAVATYSDGSSTTVSSGVTWAAANTAVATVNATGLATGRAAGTTSISASFGGQGALASLTVTSGGTSSAKSFVNTAPITIRDNAPAAVYPSTIIISDLSGTIAKVTVKLSGLTHKRPDDLDVLLVGPGGQKVLLMSDAGGSEDAEQLTLTFDDTSTVAIPDNSKLRTATYRPANYGSSDTFRTPAPAGPYSTTLSAFKGANPNGGWQLYIMDDAGGDAGSLAGGWSVTITTQTP